MGEAMRSHPHRTIFPGISRLSGGSEVALVGRWDRNLTFHANMLAPRAPKRQDLPRRGSFSQKWPRVSPGNANFVPTLIPGVPPPSKKCAKRICQCDKSSHLTSDEKCELRLRRIRNLTTGSNYDPANDNHSQLGHARFSR